MKPRELILRPTIEAAALIGLPWVHLRRRRYRRRGQPLSAAERTALAPFFSAALLDTIRISRQPRIDPGLPRWLIRLLRLPGAVDISAMAGMAFIDVVVIADRRARSINPTSLLLHELVHCVQYRAMGTHRFLRAYLRGWADAGFDYFAIPLEVQAYQLQDRFDSGEVFDAEAFVIADLGHLKLL